jgi:hypothetical protein
VSIIGWIVGFVLHALVILFGAKIARIERAAFWNCLGVALLSFIIMAVVGWLLTPLTWIPLIKILVPAFVLFFGTALAIKLVLDTEWSKAWTVGVVVFLVNLASSLLFGGCSMLR